uniref:Uncharacterized protein n=1 Tax=Caenorhabditis japonica TaxID=281687 RepID=A0A8R1IBX2_CAEJA
SFKYFSHIRSSVREWMAPNRITALRAEILLPASHRDDFM